MAEAKPFILVIEDDQDVADLLNAYFRIQGYEVLTAHCGEDGCKACQTHLPNLVILDIRLPDIDGFEVARRLRTTRRTKNVPIIFLTEKRGRGDRLHGLELGADDYITKPFDVHELRLRVRNALSRSTYGTLTNPVTGLPEGALVDERLTDCLGKNNWALLSVSIENLDAFRETYGFVASDDLLRAVGLMIRSVVRECGGPDDFVGQMKPTVFILITRSDSLPLTNERIRARLEQSLDYFYPVKDRSQEGGLEKHLAIKINQLIATQGSFSDINNIKAMLLRRT